MLADSLASAVIMNRGMITVCLQFLISRFDRIGLSMWPAVTQLQVVKLDASYITDTIYLFGKLRNIGM